jgi:hypothetical protein
LRISRPNNTTLVPQPQASESAPRRGGVESLTNTNWLDRNKENNSITLPEIGNNERRKPGVGFVGGGTGNKAAGFKNELNNTGSYGAKGIMSGIDFSIGTANGLGSGLFGPKKSMGDAITA